MPDQLGALALYHEIQDFLDKLSQYDPEGLNVVVEHMTKEYEETLGEGYDDFDRDILRDMIRVVKNSLLRQSN
jgi:hypothetical protein